MSSEVDPDFSEPIKNVTVPVGREAILSCLVTDLGHFKVFAQRYFFFVVLYCMFFKSLNIKNNLLFTIKKLVIIGNIVSTVFSYNLIYASRNTILSEKYFLQKPCRFH